MKEKEIKLKTKDGYKIYCTLDEPNKKTNKVVVIVHGLGSRITDHHYFNASRFFSDKGYAVLRIALYGHQKDARTLKETTLSVHVGDVNIALQHFRKKYEKMFLVAHSYGGPVVASSRNDMCSAVVLWDPSAPFEIPFGEEISYIESLDAYFLKWGVEVIIGKAMVEDRIESSPLKKWIPTFETPTKVICAGKGILHKHWKKNMKYFEVPAKYTEIKNADHNFNQPGAEEKLFEETYKWIKKYS